jgi:hypothetical protein
LGNFMCGFLTASEMERQNPESRGVGVYVHILAFR